MNQMEIFKNPEFGSIRVIEEDGKFLFSGLDVANALGYSNSRASISRHCRYVTKRDVPHPQNSGKTIQMTFIPEGDVYRLIVHSKLPSAERFERWVFDEVLPSIRQHGAYLTRDKLWEVATSPEALLKLCTDLLAEREKNAALREDNARLQSKAVYYDLFIDLHHSTNLRTTAKELDVPERRFVRFLLERRYVYRAPSGCVMPYAKSANDGLFCVKDFSYHEMPSPDNPDGKCACLMNIYARPPFRRQGIGDRIVRWLIGQAAAGADAGPPCLDAAGGTRYNMVASILIQGWFAVARMSIRKRGPAGTGGVPAIKSETAFGIFRPGHLPGLFSFLPS